MVGFAGADTLDQRTGEHRRAARRAIGQSAALEGVFHGGRRGDHHTAAALTQTALAELVPDVNVPTRPGENSTLERTAVTAVEQQDHPLGPAALHHSVDPSGLYRGGSQPIRHGVTARQVQFPAVVLETVTGKVRQHQVRR